MKAKGKFVLTGVLLVALVMACIPTSAYAAIYQAGMELFSSYSNMTEEEIYSSKKNTPADDLVSEIIELEEALPTMDEKIAILPHLMALIEMGDEFSASELIELIENQNTDVGLDSAFVKMYIDKGADPSDLLALLDDDGVAQETKEYIVALGDFSTTELSSIFNSHNDNIAVVAMKRIAVIDDQLALELAVPVFSASNKKITDSKYIAAFLGVAEYCENHIGDTTEEAALALKLKDQVVPIMQSLYNTSSNELMKDQAIYAMARMGDYDVFAYIIESEDIDFDLKVTTIERNVDVMIEKISTATTLEEIDVIISAMRLHPIIEVGEALEMAISEGKLAATRDTSSIISFIENNGIEGVNKYENK